MKYLLIAAVTCLGQFSFATTSYDCHVYKNSDPRFFDKDGFALGDLPIENGAKLVFSTKLQTSDAKEYMRSEFPINENELVLKTSTYLDNLYFQLNYPQSDYTGVIVGTVKGRYASASFGVRETKSLYYVTCY